MLGIKKFQYATRDRKQKHRISRKKNIHVINVSSKEYGLHYSQVINLLQRHKIELNRTVLSNLAIHEPVTYEFLLRIL